MLSPYLGGSWSWTEYQCSVTKVFVVCDNVDGGIRLSGFVLAGFIASENVDFPLVDHGHGRSISVTKIMPLSSVTMSMAEFDFLVSFLQGL